MSALVGPPSAEHVVDPREGAKSLARRHGFRVFPLSADKCRPLRKGWTESASNDPAMIHTMFSDALGEPAAVNIGVLTGGDLLVIDVDVKKGQPGMASLSRLKALGLPSRTFTVRTPSGGFHLYFKVNPAFCYRNRTNWRPGIDIRGHHGYVVGPGSIRPDGGEYTVEIDAPLPGVD